MKHLRCQLFDAAIRLDGRDSVDEEMQVIYLNARNHQAAARWQSSIVREHGNDLLVVEALHVLGHEAKIDLRVREQTLQFPQAEVAVEAVSAVRVCNTLEHRAGVSHLTQTLGRFYTLPSLRLDRKQNRDLQHFRFCVAF